MKNIIYILFSVLIFVAPLTAQNAFKAGPSIAYIYDYLGEVPVRLYGGEIGVKLQRRKDNKSLNFTALINTGESTPRFRSSIRQKILYTGINQEFQLHFREMYDGGYFGFVIQFILILKDNPFGFAPSNPGLTLRGNQFDFGFSTGFIKKINSRFYLNPHAFLGVNPFGENDNYQMMGRIGISFGLINQKNEK